MAISSEFMMYLLRYLLVIRSGADFFLDHPPRRALLPVIFSQ
jgi:hypothetical protein